MSLKQLADKYIPASSGKKVLTREGNTKDIVAEVLTCFKNSREQLYQFAPHFKAVNLQQTLYNVWHFWKANIKYKIDPLGVQWIQTPAALWMRKEGDCKSLSVAVMCTLDALGIKASFRFANYLPGLNYPTHVYVVVLNNGKEIPVDCVWTEFGTQKQFENKWDYNMTKIYQLSGIDEMDEVGRLLRRKNKSNQAPVRRGFFGKRNKRGVLAIPVNDDRATAEVVDIALEKQRLEMEQIINADIQGIGFIGSDLDNEYEAQIAGYHNALAAVFGWPTVSVEGFEDTLHPQQRHCVGCDSVGFLGLGKKAKAKKVVKLTKKNAAGKAVTKRQSKLLAKAGITATKVKDGLLKRIGKGIKKVLTTPARLAIKSQLPKNAPFFLYLYITDAKVLAKLPEAVAIKRQKALDYKNKIVNGLQMKESNFDGTVRNGIMNAFGKAPEAVIADWMKQAAFSVGFITAALGVAAQGVKMLLGKLGENIQGDVENYTPAPEDWGNVNAAAEMAEQVLAQQSNTPQVQTPPAPTYSSYTPPSSYSSTADNGGGNTADSTAPVNDKAAPPVDDEPPAPTEKDNSILWLALAAAGIAVAAGMGGKTKKSK